MDAGIRYFMYLQSISVQESGCFLYCELAGAAC